MEEGSMYFDDLVDPSLENTRAFLVGSGYLIDFLPDTDLCLLTDPRGGVVAVRRGDWLVKEDGGRISVYAEVDYLAKYG